ncbi:MAG: hypothetical protein WB392_04850 [Methanotrichaceae archaeon]
MKNLLVFGLLVVLCLPTLGAGVPNLVGNWTRTDVEGIVYGNPLVYTTVDTPGNFTWLYENTVPGIPMIVIKDQRDHAFTGTWMTNPANKSTYESLIGIIGYDNSSIYMIHGGDREIIGKLISSSEMAFVALEDNEKRGMFLINQRFSKLK